MGLLSWVVNRIGGESEPTQVEIDELFNLQAELVIRNLAFQSAVKLIANSISKCEFKTYFKGKEVREKEYYLFNVEPNKNQNSSQFIHKWINKLYKENECLIIENNGQLLIADSFQVKEYALLDNQFTQVTVGDFTFNKTFFMSDVLYFKLNDENIRRLINRMYDTYGKLIAYGQKSYQKSRGNRGILNVSAQAQGKKDFETTFEKLMNDRFRSFFQAENAVLPLFDGYSYSELEKKIYSNEGTRDIKAMIDDIYDFTARGINIPPVLLKGDVANSEQVVNNFLTFCVDPLCDFLQEEINRKRSGYDAFKQGTYTKIDTKAIKHVDLLSESTAIDKLIASGAFCVNDIRKLTGEEKIEEEWANKHYMTKNYATVEELLNDLQGGEKVEKPIKNK